MTSFEEALKKSVLGLGSKYKLAEKDLFEETSSASESVERITHGKASLGLRKENEGPEQTEYALYVTSGRQLSQIVIFLISAQGYPIKVVSERSYISLDVFDKILESREEIARYYAELASSPESRLVLRVAFLIRQNRPKSQEEPA